MRRLLPILLLLLLPASALAVSTTQVLPPGDSLTVSCDGNLNATYTPQEATLTCLATTSPTASAESTPSSSAAATASPTSTPTATPDSTPSPTPSPSPSPTPTVTPTPLPDTSNVLQINLDSLPQTGAAWQRMLARSDDTGALNFSNVSAPNTDLLLAKAYVCAAAEIQARCDEAIAMITAAQSTTGSARSLEIGRNMAPTVLAANVMGYHGADAWFATLRNSNWPEQGSMIACSTNRPNNWGTVCNQARITYDLHVGDTTDLAKARNVFLAYVCDPAGSNTFKWGDMSWQYDTAHPCGINIRGATKSGQNIDGILPDDQRRAASFPNFSCENYVWQASGEAMVDGYLLNEVSAGDDALFRAYEQYQNRGCTASGDDRWQIPMANAVLGQNLATSGMQDGKSFAFADWLFG